MKRRYKRYNTGKKLSPWAIAGICVGAVLLLTVITGNLLKLWLNDETYQKLTQGEPEAPAEEPFSPHSVPPVNAYPWSMGDKMGDALNVPAVSVPINRPDGSLLCTSAVADQLGFASANEIPMRETVQELSDYSAYISGIFYTRGLYYEDADTRYGASVAEGALLREFLRAGGEDVVLTGIPYANVSTEQLCAYVKEVRRIADGRVGVSVPWSVASGEGGGTILESLLRVCDFCVLDVTNADLAAEELTAKTDYHVRQYGMRLFFTDERTDLKEYVEANMLPNYQIIQAPPKEPIS